MSLIAKIKSTVLKRKFDKKMSNFLTNRNVSEKVIQSVAILTTDEISSKIDLKELVENTLQVRNCKTYSFRKFDKNNEASYHHFSEKDIDWKGNFIDTSFLNFIDEPFDLLLNLDDTKNKYLEYATLCSKATFKIGFKDVNTDLFDIEILGNTTNVKEFVLEVKKYLQILKKLEIAE